MTAATARRSDLDDIHVSALGVTQAEWIKFRSLRSSVWSLLVTLVLTVGLGLLFSAIRAHRYNQGGGHGAREAFDVISTSLRGTFLAQLAIGVLGVLIVTGEYSTGMIRSSIGAVPRRIPVLLAKAVVFAVVSLIVAEVATFVAFLVGQQALSSTHLQASLSTPHAVQAVVGGGLYLTLIGLLGVGFGFILRNTAGAIGALVGVVLVLPILANALPDPYATDVSKYLPLSVGDQLISSAHADPTLLAPWTGFALLAGYVVVALVAGAIVLKRRDA